MTMSLEEAVSILDANDDFRVLRRFSPPNRYAARPDGASVRVGAIVDTETTGLSLTDDAIIELAAVLFEYDADTGEVYGVIDERGWLEDPGRPIPPDIVELTGITDDMVAGKRIDDEDVAETLKWADLVIAHNARFDRPRMEARFPAVAGKPWACSLSEIDWAAERLPSKLEYMLTPLGLFFEGAHRATADCRALLHVLATQTLRSTGGTAFRALLASAAAPTSSVYATQSPFADKGALASAGYRFNGGEDGFPRAWWTSVPTEREAEALAALAAMSPRARPTVYRQTASERYALARREPDIRPGFAADAAPAEAPVPSPGRRSILSLR
jgi:DNA polymerase-3 subunit epsilon